MLVSSRYGDLEPQFLTSLWSIRMALQIDGEYESYSTGTSEPSFPGE